MNRFEDASRKITGYSWLDELARKSLASAEKRFAPTRSVIPAQAVIAATKILYADKMSNHSGDNAPQIIDACEVVVKKILEAAAPYMMAAAWQEGYLFSYDQERGGNGALPIPVPEYLADDLVQWNPYMLNNEGEK